MRNILFTKIFENKIITRCNRLTIPAPMTTGRYFRGWFVFCRLFIKTSLTAGYVLNMAGDSWLEVSFFGDSGGFVQGLLPHQLPIFL